jgi:hypothetical protein
MIDRQTLTLLIMKKQKPLKREELYDLVWSVPMIKLAKRFDLSDQGLAKKCKKHKIPRPPMGYWAKLEHGKAVEKTLLPNITDQRLAFIEFQPNYKNSIPESVLSIKEEPLANGTAFQIPKRVKRYHPLISEYRKLKDSKTLDQYGRLHFRNPSVDMGIKVTPETFNRACLFLQGIIKLFDSYGWILQKGIGNSNQAAFVFEGERLSFELKEPVTQIPAEITNLKRKDGYLWPTKEYAPSGLFEFTISGMYLTGLQACWKDTAKERLENRLPSIVQGFRQAFEYKKLETIKRRARDLEWEQEAKRKQELNRLKEIEEARRNHLFELAQAFDQVKSIRNLIVAFKESGSREEGFDMWLDWAVKTADEMDPVDKQAEILSRYHQIEAEKF